MSLSFQPPEEDDPRDDDQLQQEADARGNAQPATRIAELEETVWQLTRALRDATEAPPFDPEGPTPAKTEVYQMAIATPDGGVNYVNMIAAQPSPQPEGEVVVTKNEAGQILAVTRQDADGKILSVIAESAPAGEPVAKVELMKTGGNAGLATRIVEIDDPLRDRLRPGQLLYTTPQPRKLTTEAIRAAGGIVHSDGNIFFTNIEQLNKAITGGQA